MTTRDFAIPFSVVLSSGTPGLRLAIDLSGLPEGERGRFMADLAQTAPRNTLAGALRVFALADRAPAAPLKPQAQGDLLVLPLPEAAVAAPWRQAVLLNLTDFSLGNSDTDLALVKRAELAVPGGGAPLVALAGLTRHLAECRAHLTQRLPDGTHIDDYTQGNWPEDAAEYRFDIVWTFAAALDENAQAGIRAVLQDLEETIAWMGFATEGSAEAWIERGDMVYPGEVHIGKGTVTWTLERPPGDISAAIQLFEAVVASQGLAITGFEATISPA